MLSMIKKNRSFRTKMVLLFSLSMFLSGAITTLFFLGLQSYYRKNIYAEDFIAKLRLFIGNIGDFNVFFVVFILLSFLFFFYLTKPFQIILQKFLSELAP